VADKYGSDFIVDLIKRYQFPWITLNPGASFRGLHDSLVNYGGNDPPMIVCPHEEIAVFMAMGYAKVTGKPLVTILHDTVGLLHGAMAIYYAYVERIPIIVLGACGPMDTSQRRPGADWVHTAVQQSQVVHDFVKWHRQPVGAEEVASSFARAYRVAMQEPQGPVYLCYDAGFQEAPLDGEVPLPDPARVTPGTLPQADLGALDELAERLVTARYPVIVAGDTARHRDSFYRLVELAETVGAAVIDQGERLNFPTKHPLNATGLETRVLPEADLVLALDAKNLFGTLTQAERGSGRQQYLLRQGCNIAEMGYRDVGISKWADDFAELVPVDQQIYANTAVALPELLARIRALLGKESQDGERAGRKDAVGRLHGEARERWAAQSREDWTEVPTAPGRLAWELWEAIKDEDWVLCDNTIRGWAPKLWDMEKPERHIGSFGGMNTASQIGTALGVTLAYKGSGKLVVDVQPDGDLMYDPQALWVAAHQQLPLLMVMFNNRAYYNDWEHQIQVARQRGRDEKNAWVGQTLNEPSPDFATIARGFGVHAQGPIEHPDALGPALSRAIDVVKGGAPALVDVIVRPR